MSLYLRMNYDKFLIIKKLLSFLHNLELDTFSTAIEFNGIYENQWDMHGVINGPKLV